MVFSSAVFLFVFLPVVFILYNLADNIIYKNTILMVASIIFYAFGEPIYVFLMIGSSFINFIFGIIIKRVAGKKSAKVILIISVVYNIALLCVFKYLDFLIENINGIMHMDIYKPGIALPVGVSFFTFQAMSYVIDVYRNPSVAQKNFAKVLLYISFFPQLIAGPIVRWNDIESQINARDKDIDLTIYGLKRFTKGLFKKLIFANMTGAVADAIFALDIKEYGFVVAWFGAISYTLQIYYDFSGYSDMAIGLAGIFGFRFKENFDHPYSAVSIKDFWKRWHMSLTTWFREYVYIPLGGNRHGRFNTERNILIIFLLTGIWHGANWTFVIWGMIHGVFRVLEDTVIPVGKLKVKVLGNIYTWIIVITAFVMFRAENAILGAEYIKTMFTGFKVSRFTGDILAANTSDYFLIVFVLAIIFSYPVSGYIRKKYNEVISSVAVKEVFGYFYIIILLVVCILCLSQAAYNPFIYFRF